MKNLSFRTPGSRSALSSQLSTLNSRRGFTLVELLVVISIIGLLAAMLLPVLASVKTKAKIKQAQIEMGQIVSAVQKYEAAYNRFPSSTEAMKYSSEKKEDFTYGTANLPALRTPAGTYPVIAVVAPGATPLAYQTNNSELMAILLDLETYPNAEPTLNKGHVKNPKQEKFLSATMVGATNMPGVGPDLVYRDPWGNPYIITLDLNYDDKARDGFYRTPTLSTGGKNGLMKHPTLDLYEANSQIMVWSAGPDKLIDNTVGANEGANKDNVLSWKQ